MKHLIVPTMQFNCYIPLLKHKIVWWIWDIVVV